MIYLGIIYSNYIYRYIRIWWPDRAENFQFAKIQKNEKYKFQILFIKFENARA